MNIISNDSQFAILNCGKSCDKKKCGIIRTLQNSEIPKYMNLNTSQLFGISNAKMS